MDSKAIKAKNKNQRLLNNVGLGLFCLLACELVIASAPNFNRIEAVAMGTGYAALALIALTLIIGPFNLLFKRKNPVNLNFRRDAGIWSGITGVIHVLASLFIYDGKGIVDFFAAREKDGWRPLFDLFGFSNYTGLIATIILVGLTAISNQLSLKLMKGKRWKFWQRFTYLLGGLAIIHTLGFQKFNDREDFYYLGLLGLTLAISGWQATGVIITLRRSRAQKAQYHPEIENIPGPGPIVAVSGGLLARKRFVILAGGIFLGGVAAGISAGNRLVAAQPGGSSGPAKPVKEEANRLPGITKEAPGNTTPSPTPSPPGETGRSASGGQRGTGPGGNIISPPVQNGATAGSRNSNPPGSSPGTALTPGASAAPSASAAPGKAAGTVQPGPTLPAAAGNTAGSILADAGSLAPGKALAFTTPDTGETGFLVRTASNNIKAYSGLCTHVPYKLVFREGQQDLYCALHRVSFDLEGGKPSSRPARTALPTFKVSVDSAGKISYLGA